MQKGLQRTIEQYSFGRLNNENGNNTTEHKHALVLLEDLQSFLDMTEVPSEALDNLYNDIVKAKQAINNELRGL